MLITRILPLLIFSEINTFGDLADINTRNITKNKTYIDLVDKLEHVRDQIIDPVHP